MLFYRIVSCLPLPLLYGGAWVAYLITYYVAGYRKAVVMDNLRAAFPDKSFSSFHNREIAPAHLG